MANPMHWAPAAGASCSFRPIFLIVATCRAISHWSPFAPPSMNRRNFLLGSAGFLATSVICRRSFGQGAPANPSVAGKLSIAVDSTSRLVPGNFTGLSYELAQLADPAFFSGGNTELVALFRLLSPHGVLRVGGNSSESC